MKKRKIVSSAVVGNIVEYYDFGIYAAFTTTLASLYFPSDNELISILLSLMVFAVGFLMRPLGGAIFGHIGDIFGRKLALTLSIIMMAACTFAIGVLPTYASIGVFAPILLFMIRLLQGICVGGESAGSAIFVLEHLGSYKPGLVGSIVMASNMIGTAFAYVVASVILNLFGEDGFSWRYGFILGGVMGIIGLYMRFNISETPVFEAKQKGQEVLASPLKAAFAKSWRRMLVVCILGGVTAAAAYTVRAYFTVLFEKILFYTHNEALIFTLYALFVMVIAMPIFGIMADKIGYRKFLYIICYLLIIAVYPLFMLITNTEHSLVLTLLGVTIYSLLASAICAPAYPYAINAFAPELRYSGVAFSWNIGIALFGGTTPLISTYLADTIHTNAPALYIAFMCIVFILTSFLTRKDKH